MSIVMLKQLKENTVLEPLLTAAEVHLIVHKSFKWQEELWKRSEAKKTFLNHMDNYAMLFA